MISKFGITETGVQHIYYICIFMYNVYYVLEGLRKLGAYEWSLTQYSNHPMDSKKIDCSISICSHLVYKFSFQIEMRPSKFGAQESCLTMLLYLGETPNKMTAEEVFIAGPMLAMN